MKELSLNILDIAENSVKAGASLIKILLFEDESALKISIEDNGCGMTPEILNSVTNPFYTTRTTRNVGLGIPLFKMSAEQTGGDFHISSKVDDGKSDDHGTLVTASYDKKHLDFTPLGDVVSTVTTLIQGHPDRDFLFVHKINALEVSLDTRELRAILDPVPLSEHEVLLWIDGSLREQYDEINKA